MENTLLLVAISTIDFLNFSEKMNLFKEILALERAGLCDPAAFFQNSSYEQIALLARRPKDRPLRTLRWDGREHFRLAKKSAHVAAALGVKCAFYFDALYPPLLREISDPPFAVFYRGRIETLHSKTVSVVGTRRLCSEGKRAARDFSCDAAAAGFCVVSGLALGADGQAHRGALDAFYDKKSSSCATAAVVAGGVDEIFPACHRNLAAQIVQGGGVVLSEWAPGIPGEKWRFVSRNRIIAGLSPATVVIQAPPGSGSLLTADFALGYGRDVFFHEACFSQNALVLSGLVHKNLEGQRGAAAARKIQTRPESYVADGAPVIRNFEEFLSFSQGK